MATILELRIIGNIGRDATIKEIKENLFAISFSVAHNKVWRDKATGEKKTNTTWVYCTIWKKEGESMRIVDFLKAGTLVEMSGIPQVKINEGQDGSPKAELRLKVNNANILKPANSSNSENFDNVNVSFDSEENDYNS